MPNFIFTITGVSLCVLATLIQYGYVFQHFRDYIFSFTMNQALLLQDYDFIIGKYIILILLYTNYFLRGKI